MTTTFSFGEAETCELSLGEHTRLAPDAARHPATPDPRAAMRAALAAPLEYPPLAAALAPGDHVAVPLGKGVPHAAELVRGAVEELVAAGIEPECITIVSAAANGSGPQLAQSLGVAGVALAVHDPDDDAPWQRAHAADPT